MSDAKRDGDKNCSCIEHTAAKNLDELTEIDFEKFATHGMLMYKHIRVPLNEVAADLLKHNRQRFETEFLKFSKNMTQQERVEELESLIVPGAPYDAQLLAVDLLTRMIH